MMWFDHFMRIWWGLTSFTIFIWFWSFDDHDGPSCRCRLSGQWATGVHLFCGWPEPRRAMKHGYLVHMSWIYIYVYYRCWCLWKWGWWWWWWWIISNFLWVPNDHIMPFQSDNDDKPSDFIPSSKRIPNTHPHVHTYLYNVFLVGGLEHFLFSIMYGIILPIDFHIFQDGYCTTNQIIMWQTQ